MTVRRVCFLAFVVSMHDYRVESAMGFVIDILHVVGDLGYVLLVSLRDLWFRNGDFDIVFRENCSVRERSINW